MGLDLALAALVLVAAVRGWLKGFFLQAIGLSALVAGVYLADPIRDFARPHVQEYLPGIRVELLDRLLWWTSAVLSYVLLAGIGKGLLKTARRKPYGEREANRGDQGAGFLLGALKGAVVAAFLAAGLLRHADTYIKQGGYVEEQVKASHALAWSERFRPAEKIWNSPPVQSFVTRIRSRGLWTESEGEPKPTEAPPLRTAARPKSLELPHPDLDPQDPNFLLKLDESLRKEGLLKSH